MLQSSLRQGIVTQTPAGEVFHMKFDPWNPFGIDPYPFLRPFLFLLDPEDAHNLTIKILACGIGPRFDEPDDPLLHTKVFGLFFPNPICLAAGLDKKAQVIDELMRFGFGSIEVGTVTPLPQPGNPRPRMFRIKEAKALINRFGFNSDGLDAFVEKLKAWRARPERSQNPLGVNIGKNKDSNDETSDYITGLAAVSPYADYVVVNISSPNTPGLRDLQRRDVVKKLLDRIMQTQTKLAPKLPVVLKIAPDLEEEEQKNIAAAALSCGIHGLIVGNTTLSRPSVIPREIAREEGGLSGGPLFSLSTRVLSNMYRFTEGKIPIIGSGGVSSGGDAYAKIRAGASLVQVYTALVYEGPLLVRKIKRELVRLMRADGFPSLISAVGADHR